MPMAKLYSIEGTIIARSAGNGRRSSLNEIMLKRLVAGTKALLLILLLFSFACSREDDVVTIQALIKKGAALAEKHDIQGLLALTSKDFIAFPGPHDRQETTGILSMAFRHYGPLRVLYPHPGIDLDPAKQSALGAVYFMIVKNQRKCFPPSHAAPFPMPFAEI